MSIVNTLVGALCILFCCPEYCCDGAVCVQVDLDPFIGELPVIIAAAKRNKCNGDKFWLLLAIRKAENGGPGCEFGILDWKALEQIRARPGDSLDIQAAWAAATIVKNHQRWKNAGRPGDFIDFLADRYCPVAADPEGNKNWKRNVRYWFEKFKGDSNG